MAKIDRNKKQRPAAKARATRRPSPGAGRRSARDTIVSRDKLVEIALDLFAEGTFSSVGIRDIGRAAGVNSAMIYWHFKDKQDLFRAAIETAIDEAFELFAKHCDVAKHESPADAIGAWFDVHVALHKRLRNVVKISLDCHGVVGTGSEASEPIKRFYRHENEILQKIILEGMERGMFKEVNPSVVATMISTALDGVLARSWILKDFDILKTAQELKRALWLYLGYEPFKQSTEPTSKGPAM